jgi:hypothetical protein
MPVKARFRLEHGSPPSEGRQAREVAGGLRDDGVPVSLVRWRTAPEIIASPTEAA